MQRTRIYKVLDRKACLRNTNKSHAEANNKVLILNEDTEEAVLIVAKLYEKFEDVGKEMGRRP